MKFTLVATFAVGSLCAQADFDDLARRASAALNGHPAEAAALYRQAVGLRPSWAEGWFYLGASEYALKRYSEARTALARAGELAPDNGAAWAFLGLCESESGDASQAVVHIVRAERLGLPDNPQFVATVRVRAATLLMRAGDFTAAVDQLRPLAMSGDRNPAAVEALGAASLTMPRVLPEKRDLVELAGRAMWALYAQNWSEAEPRFRELGDRFPAEPGVHYLRGLYLVDREAPAALVEFERELKITPKHALARVQIAILHLKAGEAAAALGPAREAVHLAPGNLLCRLALGRTLLELDQVREAIAEFQAAAKIDAAYPHTHFYLSQAYRREGRDADARKEQEQFTKLKAAGSPTAGAGLPQDQK